MKSRKRELTIRVDNSYFHPETKEQGVVFEVEGVEDVCPIIVSQSELDDGTYTEEMIFKMLADKVEKSGYLPEADRYAVEKAEAKRKMRAAKRRK